MTEFEQQQAAPGAGGTKAGVGSVVGGTGRAVKDGIVSSLKGVNEIEAEIVTLVRDTVSNAVGATGSVSGEAVDVIRDAVKGAIQATEEVGTEIVKGGTPVTLSFVVPADSEGWYRSIGQGMGKTLIYAGEKQAYTLSDRATYLARTLEGTDLVILVEGDPILFNPYGVIAVNPNKNPEIDNELANQFIDWLISVPTQEKISTFGVEMFNQPLFVPASDPWR